MATAATERVFLRKASGLIKTASNTDVFIYDIGLVSIGLGLGFILFFGPAAYPGGNLFGATVLAGVAMLCVGLGMITWTVTIPRSGGIYCFGTRSMWPPFAFFAPKGKAQSSDASVASSSMSLPNVVRRNSSLKRST